VGRPHKKSGGKKTKKNIYVPECLRWHSGKRFLSPSAMRPALGEETAHLSPAGRPSILPAHNHTPRNPNLLVPLPPPQSHTVSAPLRPPPVLLSLRLLPTPPSHGASSDPSSSGYLASSRAHTSSLFLRRQLPSSPSAVVPRLPVDLSPPPSLSLIGDQARGRERGG
jgi:hypothetical protein